MLGVVIASGRHHRDVFPLVSRCDYQRALDQRTAEGWRYDIRATDFYPDALPCLRNLRQSGVKIAIVGNQPADCEVSLRQLGIELDLLGSSATLGRREAIGGLFRTVGRRGEAGS